MSRQIQFLTDERTRWYVIQLQIGFNTLMGKKLHLKCGGSTEFETDDFFHQQYAALNNKEHFRQRQKEQLDSYNKEFYDAKFLRSNGINISIQNLATKMAKYIFTSFIKEEVKPLVDEAVDLGKKNIAFGTITIGGSQTLSAFQALSIPTQILVGKAALGGSQGAYGAWATGGDKIDTLSGSAIGASLGVINLNSILPFELSTISSASIASTLGNLTGQSISIVRNPSQNSFNTTSLLLSTWSGSFSGYITKEINVEFTKAIVDTIIQTPISAIGTKIGTKS